MSSMSKQKKTGIILIAVVVVLVIAALACWAAFRPKAQEGVKSITVNVDHTEGETYTLTVETTEEFLADALAPYELLEGDESEYGLFVKTVDGEFADDSQSMYWMYTVNGEDAAYGVDSQPVADGDVYEFYIMAY